MSPRAKRPPCAGEGCRRRAALPTSRFCDDCALLALPPKRGPGRPPLDPDGDTVPLTVRITQAHYTRLRAVMAREKIRDLAGAVRWAIDHSRP